tara:strand:- start:190 stop:693 length:504 start_codon:yes stop_codon:yes gene_type:complete
MSAPAAFMAVASVGSAVMQGMASEAQAKADQLALEDEKKQLLQQRVFLNEARDEEIELFRRETQDLLGLQTVGFAKSGVDLSGSALQVLRETEMDALDEEEKIIRQYARYQTMSELKEQSLSNRITSIRRQRGLITPVAALSALTGGVKSYYTGRSLTRSKSKSKVD